MRPSTEVQDLAARIAERHEPAGAPPFILVLGAGCAQAAGVSTPAEIARRTFDELYQRDPSLAAEWLPDRERASDEQVLLAFRDYMGSMSSARRYAMLQRFFASVPVPLFYQDLAVLLKAGYFKGVLTTNIDTLLEQALNGAGLRRGRGYEVATVGSSQGPRGPAASHTDDTILIVKLHGDLGQSQVYVTTEEIEATLKPQQYLLKGELTRDVVVVGYQFESEPLNQWLSQTAGREIWWVSPDDPDPARIGPIDATQRVIRIHGPSAQPDAVFGHLDLMLLRLPAVESMTRPLEQYGDSLEVGSYASGSTGIAAWSDDDVAAEYIRGQLRRCREVLYSLESAVTPGDVNPQLRAQIEYQRRQIAELEDRLRALKVFRPRVVELVEQFAEAAERADLDSDTLGYLRSQVKAIKNEYARDAPNQHVMSAAIGATVVLAERLCPEIASSELVRELLSFAPKSAR